MDDSDRFLICVVNAGAPGSDFIASKHRYGADSQNGIPWNFLFPEHPGQCGHRKASGSGTRKHAPAYGISRQDSRYAKPSPVPPYAGHALIWIILHNCPVDVIRKGSNKRQGLVDEHNFCKNPDCCQS